MSGTSHTIPRAFEGLAPFDATSLSSPSNVDASSSRPRERLDSGLKRRQHAPRGPVLRHGRRDVSSGVKLFAAKALRGIGVFLSSELLLASSSGLPVLVFCFMTLAAAASISMVLQKPWRGSRHLAGQDWAQVAINGFLLGCSWLLWAKGLQVCGVVRTIILEHSHVCVTGVLAMLSGRKGERSTQLASGEVLFLVAFMLLVYDGEQIHLGISILLASSLVRAVWARFSHKVAKDIGGPKKLHSLSLCAAAIMLLPLVTLDVLGEAIVGADYDYSVLAWHTIVYAVGVGALALVLDFYTETHFLHAGMPGPITLSAGFATTIVCMGIFPSLLEWTSFVCALIGLRDASRAHSTGVGGTILPTSMDRSWESTSSNLLSEPFKKFVQFILNDNSLQTSYSSGALAAHAALFKGHIPISSKGFIAGTRRMWRHCMTSPDSRRIVIFLIINLSFMFVEVVVGFWTNSLGLISDAGHMLFDCMALFIGLVASFVSKWNPDHIYTYGYARFETLCAFVNGVFLVFIGIFIMTESIERISDPPELGTNGLLSTSVMGFLVNLVGLVFFHDHSHLGSDHGHSHGGGGCSHGNENMHGVFLHVLADTLGSLGVIISSLLIEYKGWFVADPICSFLISLLILSSVYPLLKITASTLLLTVPSETTAAFQDTLNRVLLFDGVLSIREPQIWLHSQSTHVVSMHIIVDDGCEPQQILRPIENLIRSKLPRVRYSTVQIYHKGLYYTMTESQRQHSAPMFWDCEENTLTRASDIFLTYDQKLALAQRMQLQDSRPQHHGHSHQSHDSHHGHSHGCSQHAVKKTQQHTPCNHDHGHDHAHVHAHAHNHKQPSMHQPQYQHQQENPKILQCNHDSHHGHSHGSTTHQQPMSTEHQHHEAHRQIAASIPPHAQPAQSRLDVAYEQTMPVHQHQYHHRSEIEHHGHSHQHQQHSAVPIHGEHELQSNLL